MSFCKDLLGICFLDKKQIELILNTAEDMKKTVLSGKKSMDDLKNVTVVTLFYENSTRTRLSFELAAKTLGANTLVMPVETSSVAKGESLIDTGKTLDSLFADIVVIRHSMSGAPHLLAKNIKASVINAGDGMNEHPTQALLDLFTLREKLGSVSGKKVAIIGDIKHSRVARSNILCLTKMGASVTLFAPNTLIPEGIEGMGASVATSMENALHGADAVMGLRIQLERQKSGLFPGIGEYKSQYGIDEKKLKFAKPNVIVLHPGPTNREVEISAEVCDGERSVIGEQVTNGLCIRMALLKLLSSKLL